MSTTGDDDPPGGSPPAPTSAPTVPSTSSADVIAEPSIVVEPAAIETSGTVSGEVAVKATGSIGRPFEPRTDRSIDRDTDPDGDSILPASLDEGALADAVGVRTSPTQPKRSKKDREPLPELDDDGEPPGKNRKTMIVIGAALVVGVGISALVLLGRVNTARYFVNCTATEAVAERGRAFPPWGTKPLSGAEWKAIALPPNAQCKSDEVDDRTKLEARFLDLLIERTSAALAARNLVEADTDDPKKSPLDAIAAQLEQALLLSRGPERSDQRKQVERMLGDVQYWRASLRLRDANAALVDASRQFDAAALLRPMHVSDAGAWAELVRRVSDQLKAGPAGAAAAFPPAPTGDPRNPAPQGAALPVEPAPAAGNDTPPTPPDAGVPTGGVLL